MRMEDQDESRNVEDVRGSGGFRPIHGVGLGTLAVALIGGWMLGVNPLTLLGLLDSGGGSVAQQSGPAPAPPADDANAKFVSKVLRSTEMVWGDVFRQMGRTYEEPKLRLFRDSFPTGCGQGDAAAGPFYCGEDRIVYLDMAFFDLMQQRLGGAQDFARAYVIGHEVGHHVQNLLGILDKVNGQRERGSEQQANALSVRLELQADCLAGVWATRSQQEQGWRLDPGDIEAALKTAAQIGDDTLQRAARGTVVPESFTHGSSEQRTRWFKRGVDSGSVDQCNTFSAGAP
jgi:predicted metalloprotease